MYRLLFIARNNAKRQKGDILTLALLAMLSAFILYIGLSVRTGIYKVIDSTHEEHNGAHVYYWLPDSYADELEPLFLENGDIAEYDRTRTDAVAISYRNASSSDDDWSIFQMFFGSVDEPRTINTLDDDIPELTDKDILVPYGISNDYAVGDTMQIKIDDKVFEYNVAGYVMDPFFASALGMPVYNIYMTPETLQAFEDGCGPHIMKGSALKFRCTEGTDIEQFHRDLWEIFSGWVSADPSRNDNSVMEVTWPAMRGGFSFMLRIVMALVTVFALMIMVIAMIIISFSIRNFIERNMKNTGILEASGYTTKELSGAILVENVIAALAGALAGVAAASIFNDKVGYIVAIISGFEWNRPFDIPVAAVTVAGITVLVVIACLLSTRRYKLISVLECLRGGLSNHNFKRNCFAFEDTALPVPVTLSLKELFGDKGRNIVLILIVAILAVSTNIGFALSYTFGQNTDVMLDIAGMEAPDATFTDVRGLKDDIAEVEGVDRVISYYQVEPTFVSGDIREAVNCDVYDDPSLTEHDFLIEGRLPESDHEIVLTNIIADTLGISMGDIVYIEYGDQRYDYLVTGIDQKVNHAGIKAVLTDEGAQRFTGGSDEVSYYVYAKEGYDYDSIKPGLAALTDSSVENQKKAVNETISTVSESMYLICYLILASTVVVVVFVEVLLVRSKIIRERRNYGVNKALGFTSGQLMVQTMISNIPAILIGCILGYVLSAPAATAATNIPLEVFGMKGIGVTVPLYGMVITLCGILAVALITALLCSLSIRKVEPAGLLAEE